MNEAEKDKLIKRAVNSIENLVRHVFNQGYNMGYTDGKETIKALEQDPCDAISRRAVIDGLASIAKAKAKSDAQKSLMGRVMFFTERLPSVKPQEPKTGHWIPVKWHEITDEERKENDYPKDWACYLDSKMPYDGQRILVTTKGGYVELDECYSDDGRTFSLDSGYDWVDDVIAWMPLPLPFEPQESEGTDEDSN